MSTWAHVVIESDCSLDEKERKSMGPPECKGRLCADCFFAGKDEERCEHLGCVEAAGAGSWVVLTDKHGFDSACAWLKDKEQWERVREYILAIREENEREAD